MIEISEIDSCNIHSTEYINQIQIDEINSDELPYEHFHQKFMNQNLPVVIRSIPQNWNSMKTWMANIDGNVRLDFSYLKSTIPNHKVPIADCTKQHLNAHEKFELNFHDFLDYWANMSIEKFADDKLWYLKDWHLRKCLPSYDFYEVPQYFGSDWLNEFLNGTEQDDYMFVYMGPKGTWTPFHADVFSSFSWSTNIFGVKKWILLCPNEEKKLLDTFHNLPFSITEEILREKDCAYFCLFQHAGDTIFVPTGWYHQVHNVDHTISINHNFFNGCNVSYVWSAMFESYRKVLNEIDDCKDMDNFEEHCQLMLKALHGMNFQDLVEILKVVVNNRIKCFESENQLSINGFVLGENLCIFDLKSCLAVLSKIEQSFLKINILNFKVQDVCNQLKILINDELKKHIA